MRHIEQALLMLGSPRALAKSNSQSLGSYLLSLLEEKGVKTSFVHINRALRTQDGLTMLLESFDQAELVVLCCPLYVDSLPASVIRVMESLAGDRDLDIADDLDLEHHPQNQLYATGRPLFHSPALGILLLPGYVIAGRAGALALLALMGAAMAALVARRSRDIGLREPSVGVLVMALAMTYPVAVFSTQIWPELPGACESWRTDDWSEFSIKLPEK